MFSPTDFTGFSFVETPLRRKSSVLSVSSVGDNNIVPWEIKNITPWEPF